MFDRTNKGGVDEEEFYVLVIVVKQLLMEPLDKDALRVSQQSVPAFPLFLEFSLRLR